MKTSVSVNFRDNLLAVDAENVPLPVVLDKIAEAAKVTIHLKGPADMLVNIRSTPRPIEKTILQISKDIGAAFVYGSDETGNHVLTEIYIVSLAGDSPINVLGPTDHSKEAATVSHEAFFEKMARIEPHQLSNTEDINILAQILKFDPNPASRSAAAEFLANVTVEKYPLAAKVLTQALDDTNPSVRFAALESLGTVQTEEFADALALALKDDDAQIRLAAVLKMESLDQNDGLQIASQALEDRDVMVRMAVVEELSRMDDDNGAVNLLMVAGGDENPEVREAADEAAKQKSKADESLMDEPVSEENPEMDPDAIRIDEGEPDMRGIPGYPPESGIDEASPESGTENSEGKSDSDAGSF